MKKDSWFWLCLQ